MGTDITYFFNWFIEQIINIFTRLFSILESFTFYNTNLLQVLATIIILSALIPTIITIVNASVRSGDKVIQNVERRNKKSD